jgi:hypothetical protein
MINDGCMVPGKATQQGVPSRAGSAARPIYTSSLWDEKRTKKKNIKKGDILFSTNM